MNIGAVNNQVNFSNHEIRPLPKDLRLGNEEKVYEHGMTLMELFIQTIILKSANANVDKLKYGYQAHIDQEVLKNLNFLKNQPEEMELFFNDFLSSNLCSLDMPTSV